MAEAGTERPGGAPASCALAWLALADVRAAPAGAGVADALRRIAASPMTMGELAAILGIDAPYMTLVVDDLERQGVAYVPFLPLGGFTAIQSAALEAAAASLEVKPMQVALAWLLHHAPNILLIPGTSSIQHLRENLNAAALQLSSETIAELDAIAIGRPHSGIGA